MASGWNLWVWLVGIVVRKCIDFLIILLFPTPLVLAFFLQQHPYFFVNFFVLVYVIFVHYSKCFTKNIQDRSKIEIMRTCRYNYIDKNVCRLRVHVSPETSTCKVLRDISRKLQLTLCAIMAS